MTTTDYNKFEIIVIDKCSGEMITGEEAFSLLMRDDGEDILNMEALHRQKELETYMKCLESYPLGNVISRVKTLVFHDGSDECDELFSNDSTLASIFEDLYGFLLDENNHKVDGKIWCNEFLGNRWADTKLNGRICCLAFYTKKNNPKMFASFPKEIRGSNDYAIIIFPTRNKRAIAELLLTIGDLEDETESESDEKK